MHSMWKHREVNKLYSMCETLGKAQQKHDNMKKQKLRRSNTFLVFLFDTAEHSMIKVSAWSHEICNHLSVIHFGQEVERDGDGV